MTPSWPTVKRYEHSRAVRHCAVSLGHPASVPAFQSSQHDTTTRQICNEYPFLMRGKQENVKVPPIRYGAHNGERARDVFLFLELDAEFNLGFMRLDQYCPCWQSLSMPSADFQYS